MDNEMRDQIKELADQLRQLRENMLVTLGDETRPGVLLREVENIKRKIDADSSLVYGKDGSPGVLTRLDRIEQRQAISNRIWGVVAATTVGLILKHIWDFVTKSH